MIDEVQKICFLDRDGTIIRDMHYLNSIDKISFYSTAISGMKRLAVLGYAFFVISNQSGIGRGFTTARNQNRINTKISEKLLSEGVKLLGFSFCPHTPTDNCACRKPLPGLLINFANANKKFKKETSVLIGDRLSDIMAAKTFGIRPYHVLTGKGRAEAPDVAALGVKSYKNIDSVARSIEKG